MTLYEKLEYVIMNVLCSQKELAERTGITRTTIGEYWLGKRKKLQKKSAKKLEKVLDEIIKEKGRNICN